MGGSVTVRLRLDSGGYSSEMTKASNQMKRFGQLANQTGHGTVSSVQAASASLRVLEGGMTGNIRAAERFIATIPGVGKALQAAFPVVGGIALAGIFVKIGDEAVKAIQKVNQAPKAIESAFSSLNLSARTANDTLRVTNDRLENEIAKLEGKPQNNLATAIDEARVAADKMAESLDKDNQKVKELLSQNAVPWWAGFLGKAGTSTVASTLNSQNQNLADLANQAAVLRGQGDIAGANRVTASIDSTRQAYLRQNAADIAARKANQGQAGGLDQSANISALTGEQAMLYAQIDQQQQEARNIADQKKKQQLQDAKDQQEAGRRAAALAKQQQEALVRQWQQDLEEQKAYSEMSTADEADYWLFRAQTAKKGSLSYTDALQEADKDIARINADTMRQRKEGQKGVQEFDALSGGSALDHSDDTEAQAKTRAAASQYLHDSMDLSRRDNGEMQNQGREAADYLKNLNAGIALQHENAGAIAEASLQMGVMTGRISSLDAAQATAALHAQQYRDALADINAALAFAQSLPDGLDKQQRIASLNNQASQLNGQRQLQMMQDQQKVASQQLAPAMQQALSIMVQDWSNMTQSLVQIMTRTIDSLNDNIAKAMTGHGSKQDFGRTFSQAGEGLMKSVLQKGEGSALSWLTHGKIGGAKADGSKANPYYVIASAGLGAPSSMSLASPNRTAGVSLTDLIPGGSFIRPFISSFASSLPHFAGGGDFLGGHPMVVGENGPEIINPKVGGSVTPNHALGGDTHVYHIDARGATDPAAIHAAVQRAIPQAVSGSVQTMHQRAIRTAPSRRR